MSDIAVMHDTPKVPSSFELCCNVIGRSHYTYRDHLRRLITYKRNLGGGDEAVRTVLKTVFARLAIARRANNKCAIATHWKDHAVACKQKYACALDRKRLSDATYRREMARFHTKKDVPVFAAPYRDARTGATSGELRNLPTETQGAAVNKAVSSFDFGDNLPHNAGDKLGKKLRRNLRVLTGVRKW